MNSTRIEHYSTVITTLRMTMLLYCWWPSADASTYCTLSPRQRMRAERPGPAGHLQLPTISGPLAMDTRSAPSHLKSPLYQANTDFYAVKKWNSPILQLALSYAREMSVMSINCFLWPSLKKQLKKTPCYRTNNRDSKNGLDFCHQRRMPEMPALIKLLFSSH